MIDRFAADILFMIVVLLISAILGFLIGYFLRKNKKIKNHLTIDDYRTIEKENKKLEFDLKDKIQESKAIGVEIKLLQEKNINLEFDLKICKKNLKNNLGLKKNTTIKEKIKDSELIFDAETAKSIFGKTIKQNDLKIIEGIGPKIESILKQNKINTWSKLLIADTNKIKEYMLKDGGEHYRIHNPKTWSKQALLAYQGKWVELKKWQDELIGGK